VTLITNYARRKGLDHVIAFLVCTLLVIFAVGAKVAMYHPSEPGTRPIAAAKAWQAKQMLADAEPAMAAIVPQTKPTLTTFLSLCVVLILVPREDERPGFHIQMQGPPSVAVRPPPPY
jgi:hypothetical protein